MNNWLLRLSDVHISYQNVKAVAGANLEVRRGDYLCIVGPNGSGKSTLLKGIMGLEPVSGKIEAGIQPDKISYLPQQDGADRFFPATVREVVMTGRQKSGRRLPFYTKQDKQAAQAALETLSITEIAGKRIGDLSGGQRQRALLARALARESELLLLDEPCAGLDPQVSDELYSLICELNRNHGITVVMATHDLEGVRRYASRVVVMAGEIIEDVQTADWSGAAQRAPHATLGSGPAASCEAAAQGKTCAGIHSSEQGSSPATQPEGSVGR